MPTMTLLPDGQANVDSNWTFSGGDGTASGVLGDDNGDTSYALCSTNIAAFDLTFANPSVAEADIAFSAGISVQFISSGRCPARGRSGSDLDIAFLQPSAGLSETKNYFNNVNYETESGTVRTQTPAGAGWTYANLEDLQFRITKNGTASLRLSYFALAVVYTAVVTDNVTFFGANF